MNSRLVWMIYIGAIAAVVAIVAVVARNQEARSRPSRCGAGFVAIEGRCCADGQRVEANRCAGQPRACPSAFDRIADACVARAHRVRIQPGRLKLGPGDWEAQGVVQPREIVIDRAYSLDANEVPVAQWNACAKAGVCARLIDDEAARPVRGISFGEAKSYCLWAGGALPSDDEWVFAAAGPKGRRYPWGDTGAVCHRACWGLSHGPCAQGASGPDWVGIHAGDATPEGVMDMAGSVAEWVIRSDGAPSTRGGSWTTSFAAELRTWHSIERAVEDRRDDLGMRCRYDPNTEEH